MKNKRITDSSGQELGRVREVEQEIRTGRYSTFHVDVDPKHTLSREFEGGHYLPLNTDHIIVDRDSIRLSQTIESLNSQFTNKIIVKKAQHNHRDFLNKSVTDKNRMPIGTVKDVRTPSDNGEFTTLLVELTQDTKKRMALDKIDWVRIKIDRVEDVGQDIRLDRQVEELSREWTEIVLHR